MPRQGKLKTATIARFSVGSLYLVGLAWATETRRGGGSKVAPHPGTLTFQIQYPSITTSRTTPSLIIKDRFSNHSQVAISIWNRHLSGPHIKH